MNLLDNKTNKPSKFRTKNWVKTNDETWGPYNDDDDDDNNNNSINFKTTMIKLSLCDYSDAYILVKGTITVPNTVPQGAAVNNTKNKEYWKIVLHLLVA